MKKIILLIRQFIAETPLWYILSCALWATILIVLNYKYDLEDKLVGGYSGFASYRNNSLMYTAVYLLPLLLGMIVNKKYKVLKNPWFWIIALVSPWIIAFSSHYDYMNLYPGEIENFNLMVYLNKTAFWVSQVAVVLIFSYLVWHFKDKGKRPFYGFDFKGHGLKPYWIMLLIMLVPILIAGTTEGFLHTYPRIKSILYPSHPALTMGHYVSYELAYGLNFLGIEVFFRGFLIMALFDILGKEAILPMAVLYVSIHFGKPLGECISSFFGGSLLGIISYQSNSIKGGLLVHVGIAWMMEISGALGQWVW